MWIESFVTNTVFISVMSAFLLAQFLKLISYSLKFKKFYWRGIIESGGLPSGHSALVSSLTASVFLTQGFTAVFYAAFFFSCIIITIFF